MPELDTEPELDVEQIRASLERIRELRLALDVLEENLPPAYCSDGLTAELWALREKFAVAELRQLRKTGHREYLIIQPLDAPQAAGPLVSKAAEALKALDELGLVVRLV